MSIQLIRTQTLNYQGTGLACGPNGLYLADPECCRITRLDRDLNKTGEFSVSMRFIHLCYDIQNNCYFGYVRGTPKMIYRLDLSFNVVEQIELAVQDCCFDVTGISVDCDNGRLVITTSQAAYSFNRNGRYIKRIVKAATGATLVTTMCMSPWYVVLYRKGSRSVLALCDRSGNVVSEKVIKCRIDGYLSPDINSANAPAFFLGSSGNLQTWLLGRCADSCNFSATNGVCDLLCRALCNMCTNSIANASVAPPCSANTCLANTITTDRLPINNDLANVNSSCLSALQGINGESVIGGLGYTGVCRNCSVIQQASSALPTLDVGTLGGTNQTCRSCSNR